MTPDQAQELEPGTKVYVTRQPLWFNTLANAKGMVFTGYVTRSTRGVVILAYGAAFLPQDCHLTRAQALDEAIDRINQAIDNIHKLRSQVQDLRKAEDPR